ncbi:hypothetical protein BRADI_4g12809v3 [Brachypodium distachyon]|uniref:Disease resistance R13L4/SHOC-2-like LRR domain-containing protein n=1 Tax=Brachypodium distachyon TaxID=15368 RepID=A0A2K2CME2_BRADI|nr:hypothetical protein BRADI_4g12809v3 [Brachypodium distachyon]
MLPVLRFLYLHTRSRRSMEELTQLERGFVFTADGAFPCVTDCTFLDFQTFPCMFPQGTMPTVRSLHFSFLPRQIFSYGFELSMSHLPSIQQVTADIWCHGANAGEVKFAETEFRRAVADHPNLPTRLINRYGIDRCLEKQAL